MKTRRHTIVFGLGVTGLSCLRHLHGRERVTVVDTRAEPPQLEEARRLCPDASLVLATGGEQALAAADRIIVSPGLSLDHPWLARARARGVPLIGDIDLFCEEARAPVIGITGTNGKSTATALAGELVRAAGLDAGVGGNLGVAALDLLAPERDVYVLELSSFHLERLVTGRFDVGCVMNVTPDHLDRHRNVEDYASAKRRIFEGARVAVFNRADELTVPSTGVPQRVSVGLDAAQAGHWGILEHAGARHLAFGGVPLLRTDELRIRGRHNEFNALTALAVVQAAGMDVHAGLQALRSFPGLPHRCQVVGERAGITFIDDSKATNLGAAIAALEGLGDASRRHIVLIAGGDAKGADLSPLGEVVGRFVHHVVVLGRDAEKVIRAVEERTPVIRVTSIEEAVAAAQRAARSGDIVLLSPACASLDMFRNYEARGRAFADAVRRLAS